MQSYMCSVRVASAPAAPTPFRLGVVIEWSSGRAARRRLRGKAIRHGHPVPLCGFAEARVRARARCRSDGSSQPDLAPCLRCWGLACWCEEAETRGYSLYEVCTDRLCRYSVYGTDGSGRTGWDVRLGERESTGWSGYLMFVFLAQGCCCAD